MIHDNLYLSYDICNAMHEYKQRHNNYLSLILKLLCYLFLSDLKTSFITSSASSFIIISMLSLFECISRTSSLSSLEEIILIVIVN